MLVEQKLAEMDVKLGRTEFKLAEAKSLNLGHVNEIADLKVAFELLVAMGVLDDSPLRNLEQIPFPKPPPFTQNPSSAADEEDTPSMR